MNASIMGAAIRHGMDADVLIVGGGLAGLCAAFEAARAGAQVVLLEKTSACGGSSALSGGFYAFAGTDLQRAAGIEDSDLLLFDDLRSVGELENDETVVRAYVDEQLAAYEWLRSQGVRFSPVVDASSGQSVPRSHGTDAAETLKLLAAGAARLPNVKLLTSASVQRLRRNPAGGRVDGAVVQTASGAVQISARNGVLLSTGGFTRDKDLLHRFAPNCDAAWIAGGEGNAGDGLRMGWSLGADVRDMAFIKPTYGKHPADERNLHACLPVYKGAIAVNQDGKRYVDESASYKLLGDACLRQSYGATYQLFDQAVFDSGDVRVHIFDFGRRLEDGQIVKAASLEELARRIEVPIDTLRATVDRYNASVAAGEDTEFGRKHLVHGHGSLRPIAQPPFYAYPSTAIVYATYCGLRVDGAMRVIDVYGQPIDGLFAAGEVIGGFHGAAYMTGTGLGKAAVFGRIAARSALA